MICENGYDTGRLYDDNIVKKTGIFLRSTASQRILPSFFIAGVQKGGTTSLCKYFEQHPQVIQPQRKDVYFFNNELNFAKGMGWYKSHFAHKVYKAIYDQSNGVNAITFDGTPNYFDAPLAAERLHKYFPDTKVILLLRNPIDRAYSNYQMACKFGFEKLSFEEALELEEKRLADETKFAPAHPYHSYVYQRLTYKKRGAYINYIKPWATLFKQNLMIVKSEDLFMEPNREFGKMLDFLNLNSCDHIQFEVFNKGEYKSGILPATRQTLVEYYKPFNEQLYQFLKVDYGWR